ncbi:hypothetical protein GCM10020219_085330 [Nonomuraea dietziae]
MAVRDSSTLVTSRRPAPGLRYSGSNIGPATSSTAMTGTPSRKTEPHQKFSSSTPPTTGPSTMPPVNPVIHRLMATVRWPGSWNMLLISDSVDGMSVAPAMPSNARAAISDSALGA